MTQLLFETPWWLPTAFILAGLGALWSGNKSQQRKTLLAGLGLLVLGIAIATTSYLVETDAEKAVHRVQKLIAALNQRNWTVFRAQLDTNTGLYGFRGGDRITEVARDADQKYGIGKSTITGTTVDQKDTLIDVTARIFTEGNGNGVSDWRFEFEDFGRGFQLHDISAVPSEGMSEERIRSAINPR